MYASNINGQYYDDFWIMTVNKQNNGDGVVYSASNTINKTSPIITNSIAVLTRQTILSGKRKNLVIT
jgi:flagellar assembly factor FliW